MPRPPPETLTLILDENLASDQLCSALAERAAAERAVVEMLSEHFPRGTKDQDWLPEAGARGWVIVTIDAQIKRRPHERVILEHANVIAFVLRGKGLGGDQIRKALWEALPAMCRRARQLQPPIIGHVQRDGRVEILVGQRKGAVKR